MEFTKLTWQYKGKKDCLWSGYIKGSDLNLRFTLRLAANKVDEYTISCNLPKIPEEKCLGLKQATERANELAETIVTTLSRK